MGGTAGRWAIVVPVKRLAAAKTRLLVGADARIELALAMATDTVRAALVCPLVEVVVAVSDDEAATPLLREMGAIVVPDAPDAGLNPALAHGASVKDIPAGVGVAAIAADLPALRPQELAEVLTAAARHGAVVVADAGGSGTTLLAAARAIDFRPSFGPDSRARHTAAGAVDLTVDAGPSLRTDVDTLADLDAAIALGLGPATTAVLHRLQLA